METLKDRVEAFNSLRLPGQSMSMHMGTAYLVNDLWLMVQKLEMEVDKLKEEKCVSS